MLSFSKFAYFIFLVNIAIMLVNATGIFPEKYNPMYEEINSTYNEYHEGLQALASQSEGSVLESAGAYGYIIFKGLKLALKLIIFMPIYTGHTIGMFADSFGIGQEIKYAFILISYFMFIYWAVDIVMQKRGVSD